MGQVFRRRLDQAGLLDRLQTRQTKQSRLSQTCKLLFCLFCSVGILSDFAYCYVVLFIHVYRPMKFSMQLLALSKRTGE